ncbi:hypothetical protein [Desulfotalea psychrophila]|uniref:Fibronectin type-III domain-containing protein n=1 Tax=Desulfotalea psychrophila (strain LSv54 / DSM 12343) TaxID=177439 RepID=Q6AMY9_DESPS|nr:hypothetical protein [Desulfotalea psychrophila]CAG36285.1 unknown protein [Desulfotalea psychrophila LSv54]
MNILGYWLAAIISIALTGCTGVVQLETAQTLSAEQAIVFAKVNVIVEGKQIKLSTSGLENSLTIEFRRVGSPVIMEYKVDENEYFYWPLPPGEYEILGVYGFSTETGWLSRQISLAQPLWIPFIVEAKVEGLYLGEITLKSHKNQSSNQRINDNYSEAVKEFHRRYPGASKDPLNRVVKLRPLDPGTYSRVSYICNGDWGVSCSSTNIGLSPTSPDRLQNARVTSTRPTLRWLPSSIPGIKYDVVIYEAYDSTWRKINLDRLTGKRRWRRGQLLAYGQGLTETAFTPDVSLKPGTTYLWSIRLRRGETISTWSQVKRTLSHPGTFWSHSVKRREMWFNFITPDK